MSATTTGKDAKADDSKKSDDTKKADKIDTIKYLMRVKRIEQLKLPISNEREQQSKSTTAIRSNNATPTNREKSSNSNNTLTRVGKLRRSNNSTRQVRRPTTAPVRKRNQYKNEDEKTMKTMVGICRERSQEKEKSTKTNLSNEFKSKLTITKKTKSNEDIENNRNKTNNNDKPATAPQQQQTQQPQNRNTVLLNPPLALISRRIPKYNKFLSKHEVYDGYGYHLIDNKGEPSIEKKVYHRKNVDNYVRSLVSWHRFKYINRLTN